MQTVAMVLAALFVAGDVDAQQTVPPWGGTALEDTTGASTDALSSAISTLANKVPTPLTTAPLDPTPAGNATAGSNKFIPSDTTFKRMVRTPQGTTDTNGNSTATWTTPMNNTPTRATFTPVITATDTSVYSCGFVSATLNSVTFHCTKVVISLGSLLSATQPAAALVVNIQLTEPAM